MWKTLLSIAVLSSLSTAFPAAAQSARLTYRFEVPVTMSQVMQRRALVRCEVTTALLTAGARTARGSTAINLTNGRFSGRVVVTVNWTHSADPTAWNCALCTTGDVCFYPAEMPSVPENIKAREGTPFNVTAVGQL